mgnify:CR=1 FL=1
MILYNVTVNIDDSVHDEWLGWMKRIHIPEVMNTGLFIENKICRVLGDDPSGTTYSIQYLCSSMAVFNDYQKNFSGALQKKHSDKYEGKYVAFRTLLEVIHHQ